MKQKSKFNNPVLAARLLITLIFSASLLVAMNSSAATSKHKTWSADRKEVLKICRSPTKEQQRTLNVLADIVGISGTFPSTTFCRELYFALDFQKGLNLSKKNIKDITPLKSLGNLERLDLSHTRVSNIMPLRKLTSLKVLHLESTGIQNIRSLTGLKEIAELYLQNTRITHIRPVSYLLNTRVLYLNDTRVSSIRALEKLKHLEHLYLDNTKIKDITPLKNLKKLTWLGLNKTLLMDCSPKNLLELAKEKKCIIKRAPETIIRELLLDIQEQMAIDQIDLETTDNRILRIKNDEFYFQVNQSGISRNQTKIIQVFGIALLENLMWDDRIRTLDKIVIEGHTDSRRFKANSMGNLQLSQKRANSAWRALNKYAGEFNVFKNMKNASGSPLFEIVGKGASNPVFENPATAKGIRLNRRIDFIFQVH
ncbi:MAG: OmpA family protein [Deltaproteobacteria bacterium]|jgi:flagellar motor protein MotB|nr:OmpA family protein [Deltaproteobacteria bacterium]